MPTKEPGPVVVEVRRSRAAWLYERGWRVNEIAREIGVCRRAVWRDLRALDVPLRGNPIRHGLARYKAGCRCPVCRDANRRKHVAYRARLSGQRARIAPEERTG